jgi:hypothetical protein
MADLHQPWLPKQHMQLRAGLALEAQLLHVTPAANSHAAACVQFKDVGSLGPLLVVRCAVLSNEVPAEGCLASKHGAQLAAAVVLHPWHSCAWQGD